MSKPVIGLTTYGRSEFHVASLYYDEYYAAPAQYVDAIRRAGGIPFLIPPGGDDNDWQAVLEIVDGVIISGGTDIDPKEYEGRADHPQLHSPDKERDEADLGLARYLAQERETPVLCICRGMQVLNVALGGTMHEHIPDVRETDIHRNEKGGWSFQPVSIDENSLTAEVIGKTEVSTYSGHHQAVKDVAQGLKVVATAPDGIIEALEMENHPWLIAVQWHPEVSAAQDESQQGIFDALVQQAALRKQQKQSRVMGS